MTGMDLTREEESDARRDTVALLRTAIFGNDEDIDVILDSAGDRGTRLIAMTLLSVASDAVIRLQAARGVIGDPATVQVVFGTDTEELMADPGLRGAVEEGIAQVHAEIVEETL